MTKILKISSPFIISPLTYTCNRMLSTGTFPDRLKFSEIQPIYKKVDKALITNYRPISLLPVFSKIFEKFVYKTLYHHLTSNNILVKEQFGFRCNNSTEIAIYTLINNILSFLIVSSTGKNMEGGEDPEDWEEGFIIKIPKKGDLSNCNTWRVVTLLSIPSKILTRIILNRIQNTVEQHLRKKKLDSTKTIVVLI